MAKTVEDRLTEEIAKAKESGNTQLKARLEEARREIAYFKKILPKIAEISDEFLPESFRRFVAEKKAGNRIGTAHPLFHPVPPLMREIGRKAYNERMSKGGA